MLAETEYGTVSYGADSDSVQVSATFPQLYQWAHRPNALWPCSDLVMLDSIRADFADNGDLVDLETVADGKAGQWELTSDELSAWSSDVLRDAGLADNPAVRS